MAHCFGACDNLSKMQAKTLVIGAAFVLQSCALALLNNEEDEDELPLDIPSGHSRVLALGSRITISTQSALCFAEETCTSSGGPLTAVSVDGESVEVRADLESEAPFVPGSSPQLVVFAREQGDAKLTVSGELADGTTVTREINVLVRQADRFEVKATCDVFVEDNLIFLEQASVDVRARLSLGDRVLEGEHPEALIAPDLVIDPTARNMFILMPAVGTKRVEFTSALAPGKFVRGRVYAREELRINMRVNDSTILPSSPDWVKLEADGLVDGKRVCTAPAFDATVLTPDVCGDNPTVRFSSSLSGGVRVLQTGTCKLQFTDAAGVQTFAFDVKMGG